MEGLHGGALGPTAEQGAQEAMAEPGTRGAMARVGYRLNFIDSDSDSFRFPISIQM